MNRSFAFILMTSLALCGSQVCPAAKKENAEANKKNPEANKLALQGAEAAKNQDWNKAVDLLKKAAAMDHKYSDELSAVYQRRGYAAANEQRYGDAINDYEEALKLTPQEAPRIHEQRAAVEMKIQDYDKALADYSELIKLKPKRLPKERRLLLHRGRPRLRLPIHQQARRSPEKALSTASSTAPFRTRVNYGPVNAAGSSLSSSVLGSVNFRFRRFAGNGARVMVMLRPAIFWSVSTCDMLERSSRTFSTR
jgi:tetratricopeptide (TPR) repeat protein